MQYILDENMKKILCDSLLYLDKVSIAGCQNILLLSQSIARIQTVIDELDKQDVPINVTQEIKK